LFFPIKIVYAFLVSITHTTWPAQLILDLIIVTVVLHVTSHIRTAAICPYVTVNT
jgi:hypothetical protein